MPQKSSAGRVLLSLGGILTALVAASCCVLPSALLVAGVSGAWIANLAALRPYRPIIVGLMLACPGAGHYAVYREPLTWVASVLIVVALGFPHVARLFSKT